jgi:hypothetical protein
MAFFTTRSLVNAWASAELYSSGKGVQAQQGGVRSSDLAWKGRGLARFQITPGFGVNVSPSESQALANDPRVTRIYYDRALRPWPFTLSLSSP